jgi:Zn finger protein HypA/HybF involved in hydrogenase expression
MRDINKSEFIKLIGSKLKYKYILPSSKKEIVFECDFHGEIKQRFDVHVKKLECPKCNNELKNLKYNREFILDKIKNLNNDYVYQIEDRFYRVNEKIKILCSKHGYFKQTIHNHFYIGNKCSKCSIYHKIKPSCELLEFIKDNKIEIIEYKGSRSNSKFRCENGHIFNSNVSNLKKYRCSKCNRQKINSIERDKFINESKLVWGDIIKIDYETLIYNGKRRKMIVSSEVGLIEQIPDNHLKGFLPRKSTGEEIIKSILDRKYIRYEREKTFEGCFNRKKLRFDFYLPDLNTCIEFNGIQHYEPIEKFGGVKSLKYQINNDRIKYNFCISNGINLIIISYKDNINEKIKKIC